MAIDRRRRNIKRSRYEQYQEGGAAQVSPIIAALEQVPGYIPAGRSLPGAGLAAGGPTNSLLPNAGYSPPPMDMSNYVSDMDRGRRGADINAAVQRFLAGLKKTGDGKGNGDEQGDLSLKELFSHYPDVTGGIRDSYAAQEAAINSQFDTMLSGLERNHGSAEAGVRAEGAELQSALGAIGLDAREGMSAANRDINRDFARERKAIAGDLSPLQRDLAKQGAGESNVEGLRAEAAARRQSITASGAGQEALGKRYSQLLGQEINNRQATGRTVTTASVGDLARILAQARDSASIEKAGAIGKLRAGMASDLAQAEAQKQSARYELYLDAYKESKSGAAKPLTEKELSEAVDRNTIEWDTAFKPLKGIKSDDPDADLEQANLGLRIRNDIQSSKNPVRAAQEAWAAWMAESNAGRRTANPRVTEAVLNAYEMARRAKARQDVLRAAGML